MTRRRRGATPGANSDHPDGNPRQGNPSVSHGRGTYLDAAFDRYQRSREDVLGAMHVSKHADLAVDQIAQALGGLERALEWFTAGANAANERLARRR